MTLSKSHDPEVRQKSTNAARYMFCIALSLFLLLSACTEKENLTGTNFSGVSPQEFIEDTFEFGWSYSSELKVSGKEPVILCGRYSMYETDALFQFTDLPEIINTALVDSAFFEFYALRTMPQDRMPVSLNFYTINQAWVDSLTDDVLDSHFEPIDSMSFTLSTVPSDSLIRIPLPLSLLLSSRDDPVGLNFAIRTADSDVVEIRSRESLLQPRLKIYYKESADSESQIIYNNAPVQDSYRIRYMSREESDSILKLRNISPMRLFLKPILTSGSFVFEGSTLSNQDRKRCVINKAELVLHLKGGNPYYGTEIDYSIVPLYVRNSTINTPSMITTTETSQLQFTTVTPAKVKGDCVVINVTPLVQAMNLNEDTSEYGGIILRSLQEMLNFGELEFWHPLDSQLPDAKKPYLKVRYTPPYLK